MAYINLQNSLPGIRGLMAYRPQTATPLNQLAEALLRSPHPTLSPGERELIATAVSAGNECSFCTLVHGALAGHYLQCSMEQINQWVQPATPARLSPKMQALLHIAGLVRQSGKAVTALDVQAAINAGATHLEIHDTVLIAAAFCMYNRYVDGLGTEAPANPDFYIARAPQRAAEGYAQYNPNH